MSNHEQELEVLVQDAGLIAPRITPEYIDSIIQDENYHNFENTTVTVCMLTLKNGFNVVGESACASIDNFNPLIGQRVAKENARQKIWSLEGYLLRDKIFNNS